MRIESITKRHRESFLSWLSEDDECRLFILKSIPSAIADNELFHNILIMREQRKFYAWVYLDEYGSIVGYAELKDTNKVADGELELIYCIRLNQRSKGHATRLVNSIISKEILPLCDMVIAYINPANTASQVVLINNGFKEIDNTFGGIKYAHATYA